MAESPASRQWLDCLTESTEAVAGSEGLLQSGMMSFQAPQQAEVEMNGQSLSDKPQKELTDMSLIATPNFSMFSSDSDGSEAGDVHLPNLSLGEATLEDGLAKNESGNIESNPDPYQSVEEMTKLVEQIKLEHPYAEDTDGKSNATYHCPHKQCEHVCSTRQEMQDHVKDKHSNIQMSDVEDDVELGLLPSDAPATTSSSVIAYKCTQSNCNVICPTIEELAKHIESHDSGRLHRCTIHNCTETFNTLADLREHIYSHRDKRIFTCRICEQSFQFSYQLRKHMELHGEDDEEEQDLEAAMKSMSPKGQSGLSGQSDGTDTDPENIQMSGDGKSHRYMCPQEDCGETFSSKHLLTKHSASHDNLLNYKCQTCGKAFMFSFLLKRHRKIHNGLVCSKDDCHQSFDNARELKEHMKTHDQVKKRPRGRPRKNQTENTEPAKQGSKTEKSSPAKLKKQSAVGVHGQNKPRPVGRPRKIQPQAAIESPTEKSEKSPDKPDSAMKPKRPRGRPRLNKSAEAVKKPSTPEDVSVKAATTPVQVSYTPLSPGSVTPTRCSARSTKGQWRSSGSKTNMGGVGLLTVIKQERTKSRRLSVTDVKTDTEDDGSGKEQEKTPRKRQLSEEEAGDETPKLKSPKKTSLVQFTPKGGSGDGNTSGEEIGSSEKVERETTLSNVGSTDPPETVTKHQPLDTPTMPKKVIRITSAKPLVGSAPRPRGRPPKSVLKIGHATQEIKKGPAADMPQKKGSDEAQKEMQDAENMSTSSDSGTGVRTENSPADITNNQAMNSKKLQRSKTSTVKTMSTRQSRGLTCVIPFCTSYQLNKAHNQSSVHFIKFPEQQEEISKWIKILKLPKDFEVKPSTRICHLHFNKSDLEINSEGMWQCREGAAPRIFNAK